MATIEAKKPTTMYVAKRLTKQADSSLGWPLRLDSPTNGLLGVLLVFDSVEAAERVHGIGIETFQIEIVC